jgi:very-short-patch-repair endonuclease
MARRSRRKTQQPPKPDRAVEVGRDSHGKAQQPPDPTGAVEVRRVDPAAAIAARQQGNVTRAQLRAAGLTDDAIDWRIAQGRLHPIHRGVFLVGHEVPPDRAPLFAAVEALGDKAYINHRTALEQYRILEPIDGPIHVTLVGCCRRSRDNIRVHRTTRIADEDLGTLGGLRITSPARAILDFADDATPRELAQAVNEAHVQELATPQDLRGILMRTPGRKGAALLTATLDRHDGPSRAHEGGEKLLEALIKRARLRRPAINAKTAGYECDFTYEAHKLVIEVDSGRYHGTPAAVDRDRRKDQALRAAGYTVLRYSYHQIAESHAVIAEIAAHLSAPRLHAG